MESAGRENFFLQNPGRPEFIETPIIKLFNYKNIEIFIAKSSIFKN